MNYGFGDDDYSSVVFTFLITTLTFAQILFLVIIPEVVSRTFDLYYSQVSLGLPKVKTLTYDIYTPRPGIAVLQSRGEF